MHVLFYLKFNLKLYEINVPGGLYGTTILIPYQTYHQHQRHQSYNALDLHATMHHFVTEMCTCVHISVTKWCIVWYRSNALWDWWNGSFLWRSDASVLVPMPQTNSSIYTKMIGYQDNIPIMITMVIHWAQVPTLAWPDEVTYNILTHGYH